jgi:hypothetical protein
MKIAIIGSRGFTDLAQVREFVLSLPFDATVVTGGAHGVDMVAEGMARDLRLSRIIYEPQCDMRAPRNVYLAALHARNKRIVDEADRVVAFWDGVSRGTKSVIDYARKVGKIVDEDVRRAR